MASWSHVMANIKRDLKAITLKSYYQYYTAESKTNRSLGSVWSKISTFHIGLVFRKVIPRPHLVYSFKPLLRPFKWGTLWCFISRGVKTARSKSLDLCTLLNNRGVFGNFLLQPLAVLMPLEIKHIIVPHLKGLNSGIKP